MSPPPPVTTYTVSMTNQLRVSLVVAAGTLFCLFAVYAAPVAATGIDADNMCDPVYVQCKCGEDPDPITGVCQPGGKNKYMCPPGPQVCSDMTNNHMTTGTCDRPKHCKTDTCGGKECKQPKPGEQSGEPKGGEPKGGEEKGQGQGEEKGGGKMPEMPKGGGGEKSPPQPQQQGKENCTFSSAYGIPCEEKVSTQLGTTETTAESSSQEGLQALLADGGDGDNSEVTVGAEAKDESAFDIISRGLTDFWKGLRDTSNPTQEEAGNTNPTNIGTIEANSTFAPPMLAGNSTPTQETNWLQNVAAWFSDLFR